MSRLIRVILALLVIGLVSLGFWVGWRTLSRSDRLEARRELVAPRVEATGFSRAVGPREFMFPADYGPHPDFQTEWWYYTGNLTSDDGRRFGYQLTFFRRGLTPPPERVDRASKWATDQIFMAHFAVTDVEEKRHQAFERFSRGAVGLAGAESLPYRVWVEDWMAEQIGGDPRLVRLVAAQEDLSVDLRFVDRKGPIPQGVDGYSQKGPSSGNASYYYSQPRLETVGSIRAGGKTYTVEGWSWMDHEFSTGALSANQVGWDWFALRLDDGTDLMVFQIRRNDGIIDPFSSGSLINPDGTAGGLALDAFEIEVTDTWRSPHSGASYPMRWTVRVPDADLELHVEPYVRDQELSVSYTYWEGAVSVTGERGGQRLAGDGYVEMTGYAGSMSEQF